MLSISLILTKSIETFCTNVQCYWLRNTYMRNDIDIYHWCSVTFFRKYDIYSVYIFHFMFIKYKRLLFTRRELVWRFQTLHTWSMKTLDWKILSRDMLKSNSIYWQAYYSIALSPTNYFQLYLKQQITTNQDEFLKNNDNTNNLITQNCGNCLKDVAHWHTLTSYDNSMVNSLDNIV